MTVDRDELTAELERLVTARLLDPLEILYESAEAVEPLRRQIRRRAREWAEALLGGDRGTAVLMAARLIAVLYPGDEPFAPGREWWGTPLGRVIAWRIGHPARRHVPYELAGAMLGISRQGVADLVNRGKLRRHRDGGVDVASISARIDHIHSSRTTREP